MSFFDDMTVELWDGKFQGNFDLDDVNGKQISMDDEITFIVSTHVKAVAHAETREGLIKRTNTFKVLSAVPITPQKNNEIREQLSKMAAQGITATISRAIGETDWPTAPTGELFDEPAEGWTAGMTEIVEPDPEPEDEPEEEEEYEPVKESPFIEGRTRQPAVVHKDEILAGFLKS